MIHETGSREMRTKPVTTVPEYRANSPDAGESPDDGAGLGQRREHELMTIGVTADSSAPAR